jgi:uncharacterized protein
MTGLPRREDIGLGSPFHAGEQAVQTRVGMRERIEQTGRRMVRDFMSEQHRQFFEALPFAIAASSSARGAVWASLLAGQPGFLRTPTPRRLEARTVCLPHDPLPRNLHPRAPIGLLGIELSTRRRNRANGRVVETNARGFALEVEQSFGNCPKYIQVRDGTFAAVSEVAAPSNEGSLLSEEANELLRRSDTTFIATSSGNPERGGIEGLDVSHRGGLSGFIRADVVDGASRLTLPDFSGNFMFNTLGNLQVNPHAGLLAFDFVGGGLLSLSGTAHVVWDGPELSTFEGAVRLVEYRPHAGFFWRGVFRGWSEPEVSPHLRGTGVLALG